MKNPFNLRPLAVFVSASLFLASACAGRSFSQNDGNEAGNAQGGSLGTAGKSSGGKSSGGSIGAGAAAGTSSVGGVGTGGVGTGGVGTGGGATGGYAGEACAAPPVTGQCNAYFEAWYHDPSTGVCRPFAYGGCGGNENRYASLAECQKACPDGTPNYDACTYPTDCVIAGNGCCGVCDGPSLSAHDLIAYNRKYESELACGLLRAAPAPGSDVPACAPCPPVGNGSLKYFVPDCVQGQCTVLDLRQSRYTECMRNTDCRLRRGKQCCEACGPDDVIAVSKNVSVEELLCGEEPYACPDCVPPTTSSTAYCDSSTGHCGVALSADDL